MNSFRIFRTTRSVGAILHSVNVWKQVDELLIKFMLRLSTRSTYNKHAERSLLPFFPTKHDGISVVFRHS